MELAQHEATGAVGARCADFFVERVGQRFAGFMMSTESKQCLSVIAPIFHELTWQLDGVVFDVVDTRGESVVNLRQHVL